MVPSVGLILSDIILLGLLVFLISRHTYGASILTAYVVGLWALVIIVLCVVGARTTDSRRSRFFYISHGVFSIGLFIAAELGVFASYG